MVDLEQELLSQQAALQRLIACNADMPASSLLPHVDSGGPTPLQLPFIIIQVGSNDVAASMTFLSFGKLMYRNEPFLERTPHEPSLEIIVNLDWFPPYQALLVRRCGIWRSCRLPMTQSLLRVEVVARKEPTADVCQACGVSGREDTCSRKLQAGQEARVELQLSDDSTEVHFDFHG